jgi:tetratricopeptide (TPR) repeat protein
MEDFMQESGPTSPAAKEPNAARPGRTPDPVVRWLVLGIAAVIILWLVGILSAMMFGLLSPAASPRTSAERDLRVLTATVQSGKATTQTYAQYVSTLIRAGQLSKAQQALDQALATAKTDRSFLYAQQADLALARKDYQGTVTAADKAMAEAEKELKAFMDNNVKNNRAPSAGAVVPASFADAALAKAQALYASKDYKGAIKAFDVYLKQ